MSDIDNETTQFDISYTVHPGIVEIARTKIWKTWILSGSLFHNDHLSLNCLLKLFESQFAHLLNRDDSIGHVYFIGLLGR